MTHIIDTNLPLNETAGNRVLWMSKTSRQLAYKKMKYYVLHRRKVARFNLSSVLDRSKSLFKDLKILERQQFKPPGPIWSEIWCETLHDDSPRNVYILQPHDFWAFVFSDQWDTTTTLRICEGEMLTHLSESLDKLVEKEQLVRYSDVKYDTLLEPNKCFIKDGRQNDQYRRVAVRIRFTYFAQSRTPTGDQFSRRGVVDPRLVIANPKRIPLVDQVDSRSSLARKSSLPHRNENSPTEMLPDALPSESPETPPSETPSARTRGSSVTFKLDDDNKVYREEMVHTEEPEVEIVPREVQHHRRDKSQHSVQLSAAPPLSPVPERGSVMKGGKREKKGGEGAQAAASESLLSVVRFDSDVDTTREAARREKEEEARKGELKGTKAKKKAPATPSAADGAVADATSVTSRIVSCHGSDIIWPMHDISHPMLHLDNHAVHVVSYGVDADDESTRTMARLQAYQGKSKEPLMLRYFNERIGKLRKDGRWHPLLPVGQPPHCSRQTRMNKDKSTALSQHHPQRQQSPCCSVFIKILESEKRRRDGYAALLAKKEATNSLSLPRSILKLPQSQRQASHNVLSSIGSSTWSQTTGKFRTKRLNTRYSVEVLRRLQRQQVIQQELGDSQQAMQRVKRVVEGLIDRKYLPFIEKQRRSLQARKSVRLNPRAYARIGRSLPKIVPLQRDEQTVDAKDPINLFKTYLPTDFDYHLLDAVEHFDVRREQILSSRDWKTVTCVTISRGTYAHNIGLDY